ncbi:phosphotransferase enzyme family protein [Umezawaea tangerina]|uniref:Ser/Thr protein kinase RdoA (MazF antagonist) n=1 Tax=Umezawaea tangerina TaxID=84725 RepID=A0A2T0SQE8_9PSEU|nr:phosphotransferase [Umezawaea tangerina]PRY35639.1 Ser/Thr protein kinase RdoA (MazF antagonist) [Umezawaea tangerina]
MKTLPDNPDADHLRRQAKDLLPGLRDSDPGAALSDAQASLAEQYGFRTWTDLKAEVDRRRGGGDVADPALARRIAARFGLGEVTGPMRSLSRPDEMGRRWSLTTDRGRWAARTVDGVYPVTDGEENTRFQEAALRAGVTLPVPVRGAKGAAVEVISGNRWRVYRWTHSGPPLAAPVSAAATREVGRILAALHGLRVPVDEVCPWNARPLGSVAELAREAVDRGVAWAAELVDALPVLAELESVGEGGHRSDPVLCHNNLSPGNVVLGGGGRLVVTGWEHAGGLPPEWELAAALVSWAVNPGGGVNAAGARALVEGYGERAGAVPELEVGAFRGAAVGLVNYVVGQVRVVLRGGGGDGERGLRHLLGHLPCRGVYEEVLGVLGG